MFGVIATSLLEAARTTGFARVPHNEDWRLIEARQRRDDASSGPELVDPISQHRRAKAETE